MDVLSGRPSKRRVRPPGGASAVAGDSANLIGANAGPGDTGNFPAAAASPDAPRADRRSQAEIVERRIAGGVGALSRSWLGSIYATCGDVGRAREKLSELQAFEAKRYVDPATFAGIHASLGEIDEAVRWFQKAFEDRSPDMVYAKIVSRLDPRLAADAGYRAIVDKMEFPPLAK